MRRITRLTSHMFMALLEGALVATLMVGLVAGTAFAAKPSGGGGGKPGGGGGTGGGTLSLQMVVDVNGNRSPNWGDQITFVPTTTVTTRPYVRLDCYQAGVYVYSQWAGFYPDFSWPWLQTFTLSNSMWTGGAANCTATLYYQSGKGWTNIMSQSFQVGA